MGWTYVNEKDETETYDANGKLVMLTNSAWQSQMLAYSDGTNGATGGFVLDATGNPTTTVLPAGLLISVTDAFSHNLLFGYDAASRVVKMTDPAGGVYHYTYSDTTSTGNLTSVTYPDTKVRTYLYGEAANVSSAPATGVSYAHALTGIMDENNVRFASWTYDAQGRATSSEHGAFGSGIEHVGLVYGTPDPVTGNSTTTVTDTLGNVRSYNFGTLLGVVKNTGITGVSGSAVIPCDGCSAAFTYDANGNVASRTDFNGNTTCYAYDQVRNLETVRVEGLAPGVACPANLATYVPSTAAGKVERKISTQWHATYRAPTSIAEPLRITSYVYYPYDSNVLTHTIQATTDTTGGAGFAAVPSGNPRITTYTYASYDEVQTVDGPRTDVNDITTYGYDPVQEYILTVTNALDQVTTLGNYDANGRPGMLTDPNGLITDLYYDPRGRLTSRTTGGETTGYTYDGVGQLKTVTPPGGVVFYTYTYDAAHRLTDITDNLGNHIHYTLNAMGKRTLEQIFDSANNLVQTHSRVFDNLNHLYQDIGAINQTTTYTYDANGNVKTVTVPLTSAAVNRTTTNTYDALNRIIKMTNPDLYDTKYGYDGLNQLTSVTDPKLLVTQYSRDGLGNLSQQTSPDTGLTRNTYDDAGNVLTRTDAKGQVTAYAYDALNRLTDIAYRQTSGGANLQTVAYRYDQGVNGIGHLTQIIDSTGATSYSYDQHGRLNTEVRQTQNMVYTTTYTYDIYGRLASIGYPSGRLISYAFDAMGRINQISSTFNGITTILASNISYEPFGGVHSFNYGDGVTAPVQSYTRNRDQDGRIANYTLRGKTMSIGYDAASQISSITDPANLLYPAGYGYDSLSRLNSFIQGATAQSYSYDADGNRSSQVMGSTTGYSYVPGSNRLAGIQVNAGAIQSILQDANGSTTSDATRQYGYDLRGRLVQVTTALGTITYEVNALGLRTRKTVPYASTDTQYYYDAQGHLISESPVGAFQFTREYVYLGDQPVAVLQ